jgi:hypothetical protein
MGCPLSKSFSDSPIHRRLSTPQKTQEDLQQNIHFPLFTKRQYSISHQFNFSSQSDFETFIHLSISETELIENGLKIQLNPYNSDNIINNSSNADDIYRLIKKDNQIPTVVYNTGIHDKKIFLEKKNLLLFQKFLYDNITLFFTKKNMQMNLALHIEISLHEISICHFILKAEIHHFFNFPNAISMTFPIINTEEKLDVISCEIFEPIVGCDFLKRLDSDKLHISKKTQKRLLLLDDQFIHIKILLIQLCHDENTHLSQQDKIKLKKFLSRENSKYFEFIWNKSLHYIDLSDDFSIYLAKNIENAKMVVNYAYPNYIISDQNLQTMEDHLELGTDFFHYVLDQEYTDQIEIKMMLYSANGNEVNVTKRASELKQVPTILEKGKPDLRKNIFIFLNGNNSLAAT